MASGGTAPAPPHTEDSVRPGYSLSQLLPAREGGPGGGHVLLLVGGTQCQGLWSPGQTHKKPIPQAILTNEVSEAQRGGLTSPKPHSSAGSHQGQGPASPPGELLCWPLCCPHQHLHVTADGPPSWARAYSAHTHTRPASWHLPPSPAWPERRGSAQRRFTVDTPPGQCPGSGQETGREATDAGPWLQGRR